MEYILDECDSQGKKAVVFARFAPEIEAIEKLLKKRKTDYTLICGATQDRTERVAKFQTDPNCKVFVG